MWQSTEPLVHGCHVSFGKRYDEKVVLSDFHKIERKGRHTYQVNSSCTLLVTSCNCFSVVINKAAFI